MVNPIELRLGNLVTQKCSDFVETVDFEHFEILSKNTIVLDGIPLTEKWLEFFGYDLITENHYAFLGHLIWKLEDRFYCDKNGVQIKYVHQLQNLYFALTGAELIPEL